MLLTRLAVDAFGVVTICLVSLLALLCFFCIVKLIYFQSRIHREGYIPLSYFNGPWVIRLSLTLVILWWCFGELVRLTLIRGSTRLLHALALQWQLNICKFYIVSNVGFAEPYLFFTLACVLHSSLQRKEVGSLSFHWNRKTISYILILCLPVFILQLLFVMFGPRLNNIPNYKRKFPTYFTRTSSTSPFENHNDIALCAYPLFSTILHGMFVVLVSSYLMYQGMKMVSLVINKGLKRRVFFLVFTIVSSLPLRVLCLGFSVLSHPGYLAFEAIVFLAFFMLVFCAAVAIIVLVYYPVADSLAARLRNAHTRSRTELLTGSLNDFDGSRMASVNLLGTSPTVSTGRNSDESMKGGSISFRTMIKDELPAGFDGLGPFPSSSNRLLSPPGSPQIPGRPMMIPLREFAEL